MHSAIISFSFAPSSFLLIYRISALFSFFLTMPLTSFSFKPIACNFFNKASVGFSEPSNPTEAGMSLIDTF